MGFQHRSRSDLLDLMDGLWFGSSLDPHALAVVHDYPESDDNSLHGGVVHNGNLWVKTATGPPLADILLDHTAAYQHHHALSQRVCSTPSGSPHASANSSPYLASKSTDDSNEHHPAPATSSWRSSPSLNIPSPSKAPATSQPIAEPPAQNIVTPALGTWAERQFKIPLPTKQSQQLVSPFAQAAINSRVFEDAATAGPGSSTSERQQRSADSAPPSSGAAGARAAGAARERPAAAAAGEAAAQKQQQQQQQRARHRASTDSEDDAHQDAAWRWRFQRRWRAEQSRVVDPAKASGTDGMEEALAYLNACGEGWHRHLANTASTDAGSRVLAGTLVGTLDCSSLLLPEALAEEPSFDGGLLHRGLSSMLSEDGFGAAPQGGVPAATRDVSKAARQVQQLLRQQMSIERQVDARWSAMQQQQQPADMWVGSFLTPVAIDEWGVFKFLLLRVSSRQQRQALLVRGRNGSSQGATIEAARHEMMQVCAQHAAPAEQLEVLGGGVMEWRRDRDRFLELQSGFLCGAAGGSMSAADLLNLAAAMVKQALPMHYKVCLHNKVL